MLKLFTQDLKPDQYVHRATDTANCVAWLLGHLALSDRSMLERFGVRDLPELPEGFAKRFSQDAGCPDASDFGDISILWPTFEKHRDLLITAVQRAPQELLGKPMEKPHPMFTTLGELANFMALHSTMHAGQITMIRRSLGYPPLV
jgi:uncharacterized damage-inducible protein DinB